MSERFDYIDYAKGGLILLVIIGHFGSYSYYPENTIIKDVIYSFHMPFFIFISGFLVTSLSRNKIYKKVKALIVPFFVVGSLFSLLYKGNIYDLFLIQNKAYFWYLLVLSYCVIILYICVVIKERIKGGLLFDITTLGVVEILLATVDAFMPVMFNNLLSFRALVVNFPFFYLGYLSRHHLLFRSFIEVNNTIYTLSIISFFTCNILRTFYTVNILYLISSISGIVVFLHLLKSLSCSMVAKFLAFFGRNSLDVYLYHGFVLSLVSLGTMNKWASSSNNHLLELCFSFMIASLVAYSSILIGYVIRESNLLSIIVYGRKK